jgi:dienelactone hydrolase
MHGHGKSEGERFHLDTREWVKDIQAAITFTESHAGIDSKRIGVFGFSSFPLPEAA